MSLGSDSVCFQMILTELANKGYETGLQFDSLYSKKLESHHLNMTQFTSVTQDPECWNGLNTNPLSWQAQPIYHFKISLLCLTWFKNRCRVNLELEEAWACHSLIIIPTVERLRGSLWPFSAANKVVFPRPWKKKPQRNTLSQCLTESWQVFFGFLYSWKSSRLWLVKKTIQFSLNLRKKSGKNEQNKQYIIGSSKLS